jgi:IS605 OrfB family transposase
MVTYGKSSGQSKDVVLQTVAKLVAYAKSQNLPIVCEDLDFSQKKRALDGDNPRYARMLSSFAYSTFQTGLASACARHGLFLKQVNPAFTSLIGRVNFASRYGLSVHRAAAFAIARRGMNLREDVPQSFKDSRSLRLPLNDAHHVTLELPERKDTAADNSDGTRHVWSVWSRINRHVRGALAAHRPSGRKPRSVKGWRHPRQIDVGSVVCRRRRTVSGADTKSLDPRVGLLDTSEGQSSGGYKPRQETLHVA